MKRTVGDSGICMMIVMAIGVFVARPGIAQCAVLHMLLLAAKPSWGCSASNLNRIVEFRGHEDVVDCPTGYDDLVAFR